MVNCVHGVEKTEREEADTYELFVGISDPEEDSEDVCFASFGVQRLMLQHLPKHDQAIL